MTVMTLSCDYVDCRTVAKYVVEKNIISSPVGFSDNGLEIDCDRFDGPSNLVFVVDTIV